MKQLIIKDSDPSMTKMSFNKWIIKPLINNDFFVKRITEHWCPHLYYYKSRHFMYLMSKTVTAAFSSWLHVVPHFEIKSYFFSLWLTGI